MKVKAMMIISFRHFFLASLATFTLLHLESQILQAIMRLEQSCLDLPAFKMKIIIMVILVIIIIIIFLVIIIIIIISNSS